MGPQVVARSRKGLDGDDDDDEDVVDADEDACGDDVLKVLKQADTTWSDVVRKVQEKFDSGPGSESTNRDRFLKLMNDIIGTVDNSIGGMTPVHC